MMGDAAPKINIDDTFAQYGKWKRNGGQEARSKYPDGVITPMAECATDVHNQVVPHATDVLMAYFYPTGCRMHAENATLAVEISTGYSLPGILATRSAWNRQISKEERDPVMMVEELPRNSAFQDLTCWSLAPKEWAYVYKRKTAGNCLPVGSVHALPEPSSEHKLIDSLFELYPFGTITEPE